ncbi:hypothetical protein HZC33_02895 [Candidatus Wolfebacteria bacterium]|nr:hypothetical protein [Candidatus Wolfebacteria bacterium]
MKQKQDFFLEEAVLDDLAKDFELMEMPLSEAAFKLVGFSAIIAIIIVVSRILFLNVLSGDFYKNRAMINAASVTYIPAERGVIFDKFNKPLVKNNQTFNLEFKLAELLKEGEKEKIFGLLKNAEGIDFNELNNLINSADLERQDTLSVHIDLSEKQADEINRLNLKSFRVSKDYKREYLYPDVFSHILGYIGYAGKNDVKNNDSLSLNDFIGKSGLESYYDKELRGTNGKIIYYRNAKGEIIDNKFLANDSAGINIETTIDNDFQNYFYWRLLGKVQEIGSSGGVGIAINPQNGEILSLVSVPAFNSNKITKEVLNNLNRPLFNRAISGLYSPGSTIKPLVAFAALKEKVIGLKTEIFSRGYIEVPNPYFSDKPSRFVDWRPQGYVDIYSALAKSSNVYFYALGGGLPKNELSLLSGQSDIKGLGIERLKNYWQDFGLNDKTGIDLSAESSGFLPDEKTKEGKGQTWRLGDTYNVSIGQGNLMITPIELVNYIAAIAEKGKFYRPFIAKKFISEKGQIKEIVKETQPEIIRDLSQYKDYFNEIEKGMIDAVSKSYGTAKLLADIPMKIAAKTGSAQINFNTKTNAFFVGYAPIGNPKIAILVLIEDAKEGSLNAVPVARDVMEWYYYNRIQ